MISADLCSEYGLDVPELSPVLLKNLDKLLPPYWSHTNPVDLVGERDMSLAFAVIEDTAIGQYV